MDEDIGNGILQAGRDRQFIEELDEALGMRELRAKVNGKAGLGDANNRFSILAEKCYHPKSIEIVRKYIDSGILVKNFGGSIPDGLPPADSSVPYTVSVMAACSMTLGCTFPENLKQKLAKMYEPAYQKKWAASKSAWQLKPLARTQMAKAIAEYKDGEPYNFGNKTWLEAGINRMTAGTITSIVDVGGMKMMDMTMPNGITAMNMVGPPTDEEAGVKPIHPYYVCAACGAMKRADGGALLVCGRCHERKYCGTTCQRKHLKAHNAICKRPAAEMEAFMKSITGIDFSEDSKSVLMGEKK